jgi:PAS domain S-box-containing protein
LNVTVGNFVCLSYMTSLAVRHSNMMKMSKDHSALTEKDNELFTSDLTRQLHLPDSLQENEYRYIQLLQSLPAAVYTCDGQGRITSFNDAAVKLWGRTPELGKDLWCGSWKIYDTDGSSLPLATCPMAIALQEGRAVYGKEIVIERPDGVRVNVLPHPRPLFDASGKLTGAVNMLVDISDIKRAGVALKESEERFRTMADHAPIVVWMADEEGSCNYINKKWNEFTGKPYTDALGTGWLDFVHPDDLEATSSEWNRLFAERQPTDITFRLKKTGDNYIYATASGSPRYNSQGQFMGYIGILQDTTLQRQKKTALEEEVQQGAAALSAKNEALKKSEERFHRMVSEVQDYAIILLSKEGIIENWNKGAEKIKGYSAEEAIGKSFKVFYTDDDQRKKLPEQLIEEASRKGKATHEGWRVRKDGTRFWGSIVITALHDNDGEVIAFSKVTRDLTEKKLADDALKASAMELQEKNRVLEAMNQELASFAYVSSHDLQEPLRKIQTFASRIVESEAENLSPKGKDYFSRMQNAAHRMQTLIEDLLAYSRTNTTEKNFEQADLNVILEEVKNDLKEAIDEKGAVITSAPLPQLEIVRFQVRQLLTNILGNAIKFSKPGCRPEVFITVGIVSGDKIGGLLVHTNKQYHHIAIRDNGIGFEPEHKHKIFEVFQRLHGRAEYGGTGIGLAICKKIMDNHHGMVAAESEPDQGATFHLYFPVQK